MNHKLGWIGWATLVILFAVSTNVSAAGNGEKLFNKRCSQCHTLPSPDKLTSEEWVPRLDMMAPMAGLKKKQKVDVLNFLQDHSKKASNLVSMPREKKG